ncbi:MAG: DUF484 family protein [Thiotrichales bacterium]
MTASGTAELTTDLSSEEVANYLLDNPEFFIGRDDLIEILLLPHRERGAVSLVERQIELLRKRNETAHKKLLELVQIARENEQLSTQLHRFTLALIDCDGLDDLLATAREQLVHSFKAEHARIALFNDAAAVDALHLADQNRADELLGGLIKARHPHCGSLADSQTEFLFGEDARDIASTAFLPLHHTDTIGFAVLGSTDSERFHAGIGTLFLRQLSEILTRHINRALATSS